MAARITTVFMYQLRLQSLISYQENYCKYSVAEFHFIYKQPSYAVFPFLCSVPTYRNGFYITYTQLPNPRPHPPVRKSSIYYKLMSVSTVVYSYFRVKFSAVCPKAHLLCFCWSSDYGVVKQ